MKHVSSILFALTICIGCAQELSSQNMAEDTADRMLPKTYVGPTADSVADESNWAHQGTVTVDGPTQIGQISELTGFDTQLEAGMQVSLLGFSSGWTSMHIFGAEPNAEAWTEVVTLSLSQPLDPNVESDNVTFDVPFSGHYLLMLEPVMESEVDFLLRLECRDGC